jgi:D-alanyl-D-alanine carboxypeptidase
MFRIAAAVIALFAAFPALAAPLTAAQTAAIDKAAEAALARSGAPAASIAVVKDGQIAYLKAYGHDRGARPATTTVRYGIGSVSKQFTAAAILMLAEEGKLSIDDPVGKYVPGLTAGDKITLRQILSHTSGYRDYWPQDYVMASMRAPTTPRAIADGWAAAPLDFQPGDQWQYSNTGYTLAGMVVEKVSGQPFMDFIRQRIFVPLKMTGAGEQDTHPLPTADAGAYMRYAVGPVREAPEEGAGWLWAVGGLAMAPHDLALWDISQMNRSLMKPASYDAQWTAVKLNNGVDTGYGLGVGVHDTGGHRVISHNGEVSGFLSENRVYPDDKAAVVVLVNADFGNATSAIADKVEAVLFPGNDESANIRGLFAGLQAGRIDRTRLSANAADYFSDDALKDFASSLAPLGEPDSFTQARRYQRGGMTIENWKLIYPNRSLKIILQTWPDGKIEQLLVQPL